VDRSDDVSAVALQRSPATAIGPDQLHVWEAWLDRPRDEVERLRTTLSADERARAARFRFDRDRDRFVVGRGLLRRLLGSSIGISAAEVRFVYGAHGKPLLADSDLWFNLSHSGPVALFAFSSVGEVGIDIELEAPGFARGRIAERFFSPAEVAALRSLPRAQQGRAFMACWTRKEAFIKARGDGMSLALDSFDVSLLPGSPVALLRTEWSADEPGQWRLGDVSDPDRGYVAAVALKGDGWRVIRRQVPDNSTNVATEQEQR
jgi:4'-phosphopantetheinyl transferase